MTVPDLADLIAVISATWPPEQIRREGPWLIAQASGGGNRVSATRLANLDMTASDADIDMAAARMADLGQAPRFMICAGQDALDRRLAARGYQAHDPTLVLAGPAGAIAAPPPPVTCFTIWPPLAVQEEIWAKGGIGRDRQAVMHRAEGAKTTLFGRIEDRPAATAFVAIDRGVAMLHALEVLSEKRRKGLAATLVRAAADWAVAQGAVTLAALVTRENSPARGLYASLQMQAVGQYHYRTKTG